MRSGYPLHVFHEGATVWALPDIDWQVALCVSQQIPDVILVYLHKADLNGPTNNSLKMPQTCSLTLLLSK